jgi:hypothetical protein
VALSQGGAVALLAAGASEDELGLTALREVAARRLPRPRTPPPAADLVVDVPDTSRRQVGAHGRRGSRQSLK